MIKPLIPNHFILICCHLLISVTSIITFAGCSTVDNFPQRPLLNTTEEVSLSPDQEKLVSIVVNTELKERKQILYDNAIPNKKTTFFLKILDKNPSHNFLANFTDDIFSIKPASLGVWDEYSSAQDPQDKDATSIPLFIDSIEINNRTDTAQLYVSHESGAVRWYFLRNGDTWDLLRTKLIWWGCD